MPEKSQTPDAVTQRNSVVRRLLLESDLQALENLVAAPPEFTAHYPHHRQWLTMSIEEIGKGFRSAYGLFKAVLSDGGTPESELVGAIILKPIGQSCEMKGLFVRPDCRNLDLGKRLLAEVERELQRKGVSTLITDVPCASVRTASFLLSRGFRIDGTEYRYKPHDATYLLSKRLPQTYVGDPYDWDALVRWYVEVSFGGSVKAEISDEALPDAVLLPFSVKRGANGSQPIECLAVVLRREVEPDDGPGIAAFAGQQRSVFSMLLAPSCRNRIRTALAVNRIHVVERREVFEACELPYPRFNQEEIAGVIVEIRGEFYERVKGVHSQFSYLKGGNSGISVPEGGSVFLLVDSRAEHPGGAILGQGTVSKVQVGDREAIWAIARDRAPLFNESEFSAFARYKTSLLSLEVDGYSSANQPVRYADLPALLNHIGYEEGQGFAYLDEKAVALLQEAMGSTEKTGTSEVSDNAFSLQDFVKNTGDQSS